MGSRYRPPCINQPMNTTLITAALTITLSLTLAHAQARDTKTVILLESEGAAPIQCGTSDSKQTQQCLDNSKTVSEDLRSAVNVEMRLDPDCVGMAFAKNFIDVGSFGKDADYINASVTY